MNESMIVWLQAAGWGWVETQSNKNCMIPHGACTINIPIGKISDKRHLEVG